MPANTIDLTCDVMQGFNFRKDVTAQVGFLTSMKIGTTALPVDITCKDPTSGSTDLKVVGVISFAGWSVSPTQPVNLAVQVSEATKNKMFGFIEEFVQIFSNLLDEQIFLHIDFDVYDKLKPLINELDKKVIKFIAEKKNLDELQS